MRSKTLTYLLLAGLCSAADWSSLYDTGKLDAEKPRLQTAITYLIEKEIQPYIPAPQATSFGLQDIDLPTSGWRSDPLDFYEQKRHLILPVRTLLFMEELSRAYGWMWANRYTTKTVDEYLLMLRYRNPSDFADGKYPTPLKALHVPDDALADPRVVETSVHIRRTAYSFILLHQFAHILFRDETAGTHSYSEAQEEAADKYALDVMKTNSTSPTGVLVVMQSLMFFEAGDGGAIHPVTSQRLEAMSHFMDSRAMEFIHGRNDKARAMDGIHSIALVLGEGSEWLSVRGHQAELQQLALKTDPSTLMPRPLPKSTR